MTKWVRDCCGGNHDEPWSVNAIKTDNNSDASCIRQERFQFSNKILLNMTHDANALQITVEQLKERMDTGNAPFLLDVREPFEHEICNLGGKLIPLAQLHEHMEQLDPSSEIVVYCHTGRRSMMAVEFLHHSGFKNVKNLVGGVAAWARKIDPTMATY